MMLASALLAYLSMQPSHSRFFLTQDSSMKKIAFLRHAPYDLGCENDQEYRMSSQSPGFLPSSMA